MYQGTFQAILHQIISNFLTQHAVCNGVSKAWKLKYVNEEAVAWLEFLISPDQFFPLLFWRCTHERYRKRSRELDWIRVPRERFNSSDNFIIGHICPDKILFMFWKALLPSHFPCERSYHPLLSKRVFRSRRGHPKYWVFYPLLFTFIRKP